MKVAWLAMPTFPCAAESGPRPGEEKIAPRDELFWSDGKLPCTGNMNHRCNCGMEYVVIPKEIPVPKDELLICANCRSELTGRWSSRNFDYEPFQPFPEQEPHKH